MTVKGHRVTVGTEPTRLTNDAHTNWDSNSIYLKNKGAASVDVGGPDVAAGQGYELEAGEGFSFDLHGSEAPYAIAASGTVAVHVLESGL